MSPVEIEAFKAKFKAICFKKDLINSANQRVAKLTRFDNNGSHRGQLLLALDKRDKLRSELNIMLDGKPYAEWKEFSYKLCQKIRKVKEQEARKAKAEQELLTLKF